MASLTMQHNILSLMCPWGMLYVSRNGQHLQGMRTSCPSQPSRFHELPVLTLSCKGGLHSDQWWLWFGADMLQRQSCWPR